MKKYQNFLSENFHFLVIQFAVCLNRHVFVMDSSKVVPLRFFFGAFLVSYVALVLSLLVPQISYVWCLG